MSNKSREDTADETNAFNAEQAKLNREWQEKMSNSAHQREVADLRLAGLNPILSGTGGMGSHTPSGSSASGVAAQVENPVGNAAASALAAAQIDAVLADIKVKEAQAENIEAQTTTELNRPENIAAETDLKKRQSTTESHRPEQVKWATEKDSAEYNKILAEKRRIELWGRELDEAHTKSLQALASLNVSNAKSAEIKASLDQMYSHAQRLIEMGQGATSAVRNLTPLRK